MNVLGRRLCSNGVINASITRRNLSTSNPTVLYSWGIGSSGQLGHKNFAIDTGVLGDKYLQEEPRKMLKSKNFNKVAIGDSFTLALTYDGDLYGMGTGLINLKDGKSTNEHKEPIPLVTGQKIKSIAAGLKHAGFVNAQGEVFTWGYGGGGLFASFFQGGGQLGHGNTQQENQPKLVEFFREYGAKLASVHCGHKHSVFLTDDGEVLTCGVGEYGLLGNGDTSDSHTPVSLDAFADITVTQIGIGYDHTLALANDGSIYSWGRNNHGQLGHADTYMDIYSLETFPRKIEMKDEDGGKEIKFKQVSASNGRSAAISMEGDVYVWGHRLAAHRPKLIERSEFDGAKALKIVCGGESSKAAFAILTEDHSLWTYGDTSSGLLGLPKKENVQTHAKAQRNKPEKVVGLKGKKVVDVFAGLGQHMFAKVEVDLSEQ